LPDAGFRITPQGEGLLLAVETIGQSPEARAAGLDVQLESFAVAELDDSVARGRSI